jgi:hypothetical protein
MMYQWTTQHTLATGLQKRFSKRRFENLTKLLLTGTLREVRGPGARYYIDATIADVYIVSRYNRNRIIGRPTLYLVVDQFSRLIVGIYVGLEPPCWVGAMLALWNCSIDKSATARDMVFQSREQWPTGGMPLHLMGDRGELISRQAEALSEGFNIDVENAPPYNGAAKGVVERTFGTKQTRFGPYLPGYVDKEFLGRDADPPALSAALDLDQVTKVFLASSIIHNHHVLNPRPYYMTSWTTWVGLALLSVGTLIGSCGVLTLLVFPLYFFCPSARLPFSWQRKDARWERKLLDWYGRQLQTLANSLSVRN